MNGVQIEYLLGLYFIVTSVSWASGQIKAEAWKLVCGVVLTIMAVLGISLIR